MNTVNVKLSKVKQEQLRINIRMLNGNNLPHELLLTTRQKIKLRNAFENNMLADIKLSKAQISKISNLVGS